MLSRAPTAERMSPALQYPLINVVYTTTSAASPAAGMRDTSAAAPSTPPMFPHRTLALMMLAKECLSTNPLRSALAKTSRASLSCLRCARSLSRLLMKRIFFFRFSLSSLFPSLARFPPPATLLSPSAAAAETESEAALAAEEAEEAEEPAAPRFVPAAEEAAAAAEKASSSSPRALLILPSLAMMRLRTRLCSSPWSSGERSRSAWVSRRVSSSARVAMVRLKRSCHEIC